MYKNPLGPINGGVPTTCAWCILMGTRIIKGSAHHGCYRNWQDRTWMSDEPDHAIKSPEEEGCDEYRPSHVAIQFARDKQDAVELARAKKYLDDLNNQPHEQSLF